MIPAALQPQPAYQAEPILLPTCEPRKPRTRCDSRHVAERDDTWASPLDVLRLRSDAAFSRQYQGAANLTSSVSVDYTANLRCTQLSSATSYPTVALPRGRSRSAFSV